MRTIRIGITTSFSGDEHRLHRSYCEAVHAAGAVPLLMPLVITEEQSDAASRAIDGLIVSGGPAVCEGLIGTLPAELDGADPVRWRSDRRLVRHVVDEGKPVLGICYGMQLLNAMAGGTIYADVERQVPGSVPHSEKRGATDHQLRILPNSHLARILGRTILEVNTRHLQAVAQVGRGYRVSASASDGSIEAIENESGTSIGVQWHPERMGDSMQPLFEHLVSGARRSSSRKEHLSSTTRTINESPTLNLTAT